MRQFAKISFFFFCSLSVLFAETIEEKFSSLDAIVFKNQKDVSSFAKINDNIDKIRQELQEKYQTVKTLVEEQADNDLFEQTLVEINALRDELFSMETKVAKKQTDEVCQDSTGFEIWDQGEIALGQLITEYGTYSHLYVIPAEISSMRVNISTHLMVPRASWDSILEGILLANGVGIKKINAYTKQLYLVKSDFMGSTTVLSDVEHLDCIDASQRVAFIYQPRIENVKASFQLLEKVKDAKTTFIYQAGDKILLTGAQQEVSRLVGLCEKVWEKSQEKKLKILSLTKLNKDEVVKILKNYFQGLSDVKSSSPFKSTFELSATPIAGENSIALIGSKATIDRAELLIKDAESQIDDPTQLVVYWHPCSHTAPGQLAEILQKVYQSLLSSSVQDKKSLDKTTTVADVPYASPPPPMDGSEYTDYDYGYQNPFMNPYASYEERNEKDPMMVNKEKEGCFLPYASSNSLLMVVRKDTLPKIKEVIKRLDVPKRMVEIEVLLCERRLQNTNRSGLNILKLGQNAIGKDHQTLAYSPDHQNTATQGILEFVFGRAATDSIPAFDVTYQFLLSQEDINVTASPSVTAISQTPTTISVTDQISIMTGVSPMGNSGNSHLRESFERGEFGIQITLTPTVHEPEIDEEDQNLYITLNNDISFETIKSDKQGNDRPQVHKRCIKNEVRILDGETIILGGLRNKSSEINEEKIPFLGEIPGLGKLFGSHVQSETANEMFIFIKPRVIKDPKEDFAKIREEKLRKRPGDNELIFTRLQEAKERRQKRFFSQSFELFFPKTGDTSLMF